MNRRILVTGMGTVNPLGMGVEEFWGNSLQGKSGVSRIDAFHVPAEQSGIAGIARGFVPAPSVAHMDRSCQFAAHAAREALDQAGFPPDASRFFRNAGVFFSSAISQIGTMERQFAAETRNGTSSLPRASRQAPHGTRDNPFQFDTAGILARHLGFGGPYVSVTTGCTGGLDAIGYAMDCIRDGVVDVAVAGSAESPITPLVVSSFSAIRATSMRNASPAEASRPFDRGRDGFVLAEGCGVLVLESEEHARSRGATVLAELKGFASLNNCYHMTDIPEDGASIAEVSISALRDARMSPDSIDFVNAHGSSTPQNDVAEAMAIHILFGKRAPGIPVTSIKSQIGHPLSAANSIEVIASILSLRDQLIPPTLNLVDKDERCRVDVVSGRAREAAIRNILKTSSGFSGIHSTLVIGSY